MPHGATQEGRVHRPIGDLGAELALEGREGRYEREADPYWGFAGRLFGGYSAALALVAAAREAPTLEPLSAWVQFLEPVPAGRVELEVEELRPGSRVTALRTTVVADGRPMLTLDAWFGARGGEAWSPEGPVDEVPPPEECPPALWRLHKSSFDASFDRRRLDYPATRKEFVGWHRGYELWLRPEPPEEVGPGVPAAIDLMCFDLHLTERLVEQPGFTPVRSFSYDLALWWHDTAPAGWRRLRVESVAHGRAGACEAWMWTHDGRPRAGAAQQVKLGRTDG